MSAAQRIDRVRQEMARRNLDALFVSQPQNVYYLSTFRPMMWGVVQPADDPEGFVLVEKDRHTFICDDRYDATPAKNGGAQHARLTAPGGLGVLCELLSDRLKGRAKRVGYESAGLLHSDAVTMFAKVNGVEWVACDDLVMGMRLCKDAEEQALLKEAARITDGAYTHVLQHLKVGMTEHAVAEVINDYLRKHSEGCSFNTIVGFGETAAAPHYEPSHTRKLEKGHLVLMDFGSIHKGYMGDMTRMAVMGPPTDKQKKTYHMVLEAQMACLAGLRPGMTGHDADAIVRNVFEKHGVVDKFIHGTGHGIGLAVHEPPRLKPTFENKLVPGTVFSVEPGLYEVGWGGIRIEDLVIMGESGPIDITNSPKAELQVVAC